MIRFLKLFFINYRYVLLGVILLLILYFLSDINFKNTLSFLSIVISIISLTLFLFNYQINKNKIQFELFMKFNEKYAKLNNSLNEILKNENTTENITEVENILSDYLNLCAEEYYWYKKGLISNEIWNTWKSYIEVFLKEIMDNKNVKEIIINEKKKFNKSYYGFFEYKPIKNIILK